ncbi:caspase family protein [candidate division KSB1 bacterium]|nr:caspase family protein [candidate division KSB1 bacterium]
MPKRIIQLLCLLFIGTSILFAKEKYALVIGINDYKSPRIRDLNYSEADALYLKDMLIRYARYKPQNVKILLGEAATYARIKSEIYWLGQAAEKDDDVFFYFSGHGTRVEDSDRNESDGMDEAFCPYETDIDNPASVILDDEIGHWFRRINAKQVIVVLDCCHSGGAAGRSLENDGSKGLEMGAASTGRGLLNPDDDPYARDLNVDNKFIMTASDADEQSFENPQLGHGVFTYFIGEAMRGDADANNDREITTLEMYDYTKAKTLEFAKSIKRQQTPNKFGTLDHAVIAEVNNQMCDLKLYDPDFKIIGLGIGGNMVKIGDIFIVKKNMQSYARDLEIADRDVFKIEITDVKSDFSEGKIIEEYIRNLAIDPDRYSDYYAVKQVLGSLSIITTPWSTVYLDGKDCGPTPLTIQDVPEGEHEIEFRIDVTGYPRRVQKNITVQGNSKQQLVERFEKK